jgi:hypothetical protein
MANTAQDVVDFDEMYPGRFLKAGEFNGRDVHLTITRVYKDELEGNKGKQVKGILSFRETPKELALNKTNGECIKAMFGRKVQEWVGKRVTLYPQKIESDLADIAIRVRGSPDLAADVTFTLSLPRKKPREVTLKKTPSGRAAAVRPGSPGAAANGSSGAPASSPPVAPATGAGEDREPTDAALAAEAARAANEEPIDFSLS